jgi:DNA-directed RNA polymerase specialized sigma subunit
MEAHSGEEPAGSALDLQELREAVVDCIELLTEQDQFLLEATHIERIPVRELAVRIGLHKSHTYRLVKLAEIELRDQCLLHPVVLAYLGLAGAIVALPEVVVAVECTG